MINVLIRGRNWLGRSWSGFGVVRREMAYSRNWLICTGTRWKLARFAGSLSNEPSPQGEKGAFNQNAHEGRYIFDERTVFNDQNETSFGPPMILRT